MTHEFVEKIPKKLKEGVVYISLPQATMAHLCCCGCGNLVINPISPSAWKFGFDGKAISIYPAIVNWNLECKSNYWIKRGKVIWTDKRSGKRTKKDWTTRGLREEMDKMM